MNDSELKLKRNNTARLFEHSSKIHRNCVRINVGNTIEHERKKFETCFELKKQGKEFITEAVFEKSRKRADIVVLDDGLCIEIAHSESEESLKCKDESYPLPIRIIRI